MCKTACQRKNEKRDEDDDDDMLMCTYDVTQSFMLLLQIYLHRYMYAPAIFYRTFRQLYAYNYKNKTTTEMS